MVLIGIDPYPYPILYPIAMNFSTLRPPTSAPWVRGTPPRQCGIGCSGSSGRWRAPDSCWEWCQSNSHTLLRLNAAPVWHNWILHDFIYHVLLPFTTLSMSQTLAKHRGVHHGSPWPPPSNSKAPKEGFVELCLAHLRLPQFQIQGRVHLWSDDSMTIRNHPPALNAFLMAKAM